MENNTLELIKSMILNFQTDGRKYKSNRERAICADVLLDDILTVIRKAEKGEKDGKSTLR